MDFTISCLRTVVITCPKWQKPEKTEIAALSSDQVNDQVNKCVNKLSFPANIKKIRVAKV